MSDQILVSYHTPEYAGEVEAFETAVADHGHVACVEERPDQGSWRLNCGMKPRFLLEMLRFHKCPVLWVDIDARVAGELPILDELHDYDFGAWFIPWDQMHPHDRPGGCSTRNDGIASGTMWFNNTPAAIEFLELWIDHESGQGHYGQIVLGETWHWHRDNRLQTKRLPQKYCKVFDRPWKRGESGPIQIEHFQASRRLKHK